MPFLVACKQTGCAPNAAARKHFQLYVNNLLIKSACSVCDKPAPCGVATEEADGRLPPNIEWSTNHIYRVIKRKRTAEAVGDDKYRDLPVSGVLLNAPPPPPTPFPPSTAPSPPHSPPYRCCAVGSVSAARSKECGMLCCPRLCLAPRSKL